MIENYNKTTTFNKQVNVLSGNHINHWPPHELRGAKTHLQLQLNHVRTSAISLSTIACTSLPQFVAAFKAPDTNNSSITKAFKDVNSTDGN